MTSIDMIKQRMVAAFGALVLTAMSVGAAAGPVPVVEPAPQFAASQGVVQGDA